MNKIGRIYYAGSKVKISAVYPDRETGRKASGSISGEKDDLLRLAEILAVRLRKAVRDNGVNGI